MRATRVITLDESNTYDKPRGSLVQNFRNEISSTERRFIYLTQDTLRLYEKCRIKSICRQINTYMYWTITNIYTHVFNYVVNIWATYYVVTTKKKETKKQIYRTKRYGRKKCTTSGHHRQDYIK